MKRRWSEGHQEGIYSLRVLGDVIPTWHALVLQAAKLEVCVEEAPLSDQGELPGKSRAGEGFPKHTRDCDGIVISVFYSEILCIKVNLLTKYSITEDGI